MGEIEQKLGSVKEIEERCSRWVDINFKGEGNWKSQENDAKRKALEYDDYCDTDSEFNSVSECGKKRRRLGKQMKDEVLSLTCSWKDCAFGECGLMNSFVEHVSQHVSEVKIKQVDDDSEAYVCQWEDCTHECTDSQEIIRHVNFHSYHTKLKCIGSNIRERVKLPKCLRDPEWKNIIDVPLAHLCQWEECLKTFNNYSRYLNHVGEHIEDNPRGNNVEGGIKCKWTGCTGKYPSLHKLRDHMKSHSKEKTVACPHCGAMFASNNKFYDHCKRQIPLEVQGFQCSHCNKFYPTETILRSHMRLHIFSYKCTMCDMSCESPASLAKHVRYRHIDTRTYPCQLCSHAAKSQQDLDSHMTVHMDGPNFLCHYEGCSYTCKGAYVLDRHIERLHNSEVRYYCCHECPVRYRKSNRLTKHLMETHNLQWPSGHKRFQYKKDEDGFYRIQMVRYESIDVESDERTTSAQKDPAATNKQFKFNVIQTSTFPQIQVVEFEEKETSEKDHLEIEPVEQYEENHAAEECSLQIIDCDNGATIMVPVVSNILISIDEVDEHGNIIESKIVEAQETTELPPSLEPPIILN